MWIQQVVSVCSKLRVKLVKGSPIPPISNAPATLPRQNDRPCGAAKVPSGTLKITSKRVASPIGLGWGVDDEEAVKFRHQKTRCTSQGPKKAEGNGDSSSPSISA